MTERFVYVSYIRTSAAKLWAALTSAEFTKQYWFGVSFESTFEAGAVWNLVYADGTVTDAGETSRRTSAAGGAIPGTMSHHAQSRSVRSYWVTSP